MSIIDAIAQARTAWHHRRDVQQYIAILGTAAQGVLELCPGIAIVQLVGTTIEDKNHKGGGHVIELPGAQLDMTLGINAYTISIQGDGIVRYMARPGVVINMTPDQFMLRVARDAAEKKTLTTV